MEEQVKEWVRNKLHNNPDWFEVTFIPNLERLLERAHVALHQANKVGTLEQIKYNQGFFDGVQGALNIVGSTKLGEQTKTELPSANRSIWRMFGLGD